ncbi:MAG: methionine adenosyltransferase domain-containing protein, partial [Gammaproteobacteria bacterium]|nr:methionine adenosyltransferase domain-containing protein [Gammaproteobacteria bacterium]
DISQDRLAEAIEKVFDFSVRGIIDQLNLREQEYLPTAAFGHFGRNNGEFSWERTDKIEELKAAIKDA